MFLMDYKIKSLFANCRRTLKSMGKLEIIAHSIILSSYYCVSCVHGLYKLEGK